MKRIIIIPAAIAEALRAHLFQDELEQGAFLFAQADERVGTLSLRVVDVYLVPPTGWQIQEEVYLEMKDAERAKIMKMARDRSFAAIDCHSHPGTMGDVSFSPSDRKGISDFAPYAKWKLDARPFAAMVWAETSVDAVIWHGDFAAPQAVNAIQIAGASLVTLTPTASWFQSPHVNWWSTFYGR